MNTAQIKHISLDAWNTVLAPNPDYARARAQHLSHVYLCSEQFAKHQYQEVKKFADKTAEIYGQAVFIENLINVLHEKFPNVGDRNQDLTRSAFDVLFQQYPPSISFDARQEITRLSKLGYTFSITSNTNFISGSVLGPFLKKAIPELSFMLFSDLMPEVGVMRNMPNQCRHSIKPAKPHHSMFAEVLRYANCARDENTDRLEMQNVLHIGDSEVCDFKGALDAGMQARLISNADGLVDVLKGI